MDLIFQGELKLGLRIVAATASISNCFKVLSYSRGFSQTAFISNMLITVFEDMKYFFLIMIWVVLGFTFAFAQMQDRKTAGIDDVNFYSMFKTMYNLLLGDFERFSEIMTKENTGTDPFIFILFFLVTIFLVIVMLNLLIAFVNDSYVKALQYKDITFLQQRILIIATIEKEMSNSLKKELDRKFGSKYLFAFEPEKVDEENDQMKLNFNELKELYSQLYQKINSLQVNLQQSIAPRSYAKPNYANYAMGAAQPQVMYLEEEPSYKVIQNDNNDITPAQYLQENEPIIPQSTRLTSNESNVQVHTQAPSSTRNITTSRVQMPSQQVPSYAYNNPNYSQDSGIQNIEVPSYNYATQLTPLTTQQVYANSAQQAPLATQQVYANSTQQAPLTTQQVYASSTQQTPNVYQQAYAQLPQQASLNTQQIYGQTLQNKNDEHQPNCYIQQMPSQSQQRSSRMQQFPRSSSQQAYSQQLPIYVQQVPTSISNSTTYGQSPTYSQQTPKLVQQSYNQQSYTQSVPTQRSPIVQYVTTEQLQMKSNPISTQQYQEINNDSLKYSDKNSQKQEQNIIQTSLSRIVEDEKEDLTLSNNHSLKQY